MLLLLLVVIACEAKLSLKWQTDAGVVSGTHSVGVEGDIVCATTPAPGWFQASYLLAFSATTGNAKWSTLLDNPPAVGCPISNGVVNTATSKSLYAISASNGDVKWLVNANVASNPVYQNGAVYVGGGHSCFAYDSRTGALKWSYDTGNWVSAPPVIAGGMVFFSGYPNIYAVDEMTVKYRWNYTYPTGGLEADGCAASGGLVFFQAVGLLYALDSRSGSVKWTYKTDDSATVVGRPVVADGVVFASTQWWAFALDAATGALKWKFQPGSRDPWDPTSAAVMGGSVFFGVGQGTMLGIIELDVKTGAQKGSYVSGHIVWRQPIAVNNTVYFTDNSQTLFALSVS